LQWQAKKSNTFERREGYGKGKRLEGRNGSRGKRQRPHKDKDGIFKVIKRATSSNEMRIELCLRRSQKMATQKTNTKTKIIGEFNKNSWEVVRVQFTDFKEQKLLDVRVWVLKDSGDYIPTKKGLSLKLEQVEDLKQVIDRAVTEIEKAEGQGKDSSGFS